MNSTIRKAEQNDWDAILLIRNHPSNCLWFGNPEFITPKVHHAFMSEKGQNYWVCELEDKIIAGWIGVVEGDIRVCVHPRFKQHGLATKMMQFLYDNEPTLMKTAFAKVKSNNVGSLKLFEKFGFVQTYVYMEKS